MDKTILEILLNQKYIFFLIGIIIFFVFLLIFLLVPQTRVTIHNFFTRIIRIAFKKNELTIDLSDSNQQTVTNSNIDKDMSNLALDIEKSKLHKVRLNKIKGNIRVKSSIIDDVTINESGSIDNGSNRK